MNWKFLGQRVGLRSVLAILPGSTWARFHLGNAYAEHGFPERAVPEWTRACETATPRPAALQNLGAARLKQKDHAGAFAAYERLLAIAPTDDLRLTVGVLAAALKQDARALEILRAITDPAIRAKVQPKIDALAKKLA